MDNASSTMIQDYQLTIENRDDMHVPMEQEMEEKQETGGHIDADLEISDSEDEQPPQDNEQENHEGLYF